LRIGKTSPTFSVQTSAMFGMENVMAQTLLGTLVVDMGIQWFGWALAALLKTEKFYDLFGSLTFIALSLQSLLSNESFASRQVILTSMVICWAVRLGSYLVARITRDGSDKRFEEAKSKPATFFVYWSLQGVWVWLTALPLFLLNGISNHPALTAVDFIGMAVWAVGLFFETVADGQKWVFKSDPKNDGRFIQTGLWKYSRHPNYFGEILVWWGVFITSVTSLTGWQIAVAAASPIFVMTLLLYVSGVPLLEASADKRWGNDLEYQEYKSKSRVLLPIPRGSI